MSVDILSNIHQRDSLWFKFRKEKDNGNDKDKIKLLYKEYCILRNRVQGEIKSAKSKYYMDKIDEHKHNAKKLYALLKNLGYSNKRNEKSNVLLEVDGELMHDPEKVASYMYINHFYTNVASFLVNKLPTRSGLYDIF